MSIILGWLGIGLLLVMLPFFVIGWLFSGWRPFLMPLILWAIAVFVFHLWAFGWVVLPFQYLLAGAGYAWGGKVRTGKELDEILTPESKVAKATPAGDKQK